MARKIYGKKVKGASHVRSGMPCQDNFRIERIGKDLSIIAVADGHGSEKSPKSKNGSQIAVNVFCHVMNEYLMNYNDSVDRLITYLNRDGQIRFAQYICSEWQKRVRDSFKNTKEECALDDEGKPEWNEVYRLYGTTLLGLLITNTYVFAFQIGDGDIVLVDGRSISPVVETEKILGTETHSLSSKDPWKNAVSIVMKRDADADLPYLYMLSTDGFVNSYASQADYEKTCRDYYDMIGEHGFDKVCENLENWLTETSELGCGDDITLVLAYFDDEESGLDAEVSEK